MCVQIYCIYYLLFSCNAIHIIATRIRLKTNSDLNTKHELKVCICVCLCVFVCACVMAVWYIMVVTLAQCF